MSASRTRRGSRIVPGTAGVTWNAPSTSVALASTGAVLKRSAVATATRPSSVASAAWTRTGRLVAAIRERSRAPVDTRGLPSRPKAMRRVGHRVGLVATPDRAERDRHRLAVDEQGGRARGERREGRIEARDGGRAVEPAELHAADRDAGKDTAAAGGGDGDRSAHEHDQTDAQRGEEAEQRAAWTARSTQDRGTWGSEDGGRHGTRCGVRVSDRMGGEVGRAPSLHEDAERRRTVASRPGPPARVAGVWQNAPPHVEMTSVVSPSGRWYTPAPSRLR